MIGSMYRVFIWFEAPDQAIPNTTIIAQCSIVTDDMLELYRWLCEQAVLEDYGISIGGETDCEARAAQFCDDRTEKVHGLRKQISTWEKEML